MKSEINAASKTKGLTDFFSPETENTVFKIPLRILRKSFDVGWTSLLVRTFEQSANVEPFDCPIFEDQTVAVCLGGVSSESVTTSSLTRNFLTFNSSISILRKRDLRTTKRPIAKLPTANAPIANAPTANAPNAVAPIANAPTAFAPSAFDFLFKCVSRFLLSSIFIDIFYRSLSGVKGKSRMRFPVAL